MLTPLWLLFCYYSGDFLFDINLTVIHLNISLPLYYNIGHLIMFLENSESKPLDVDSEDSEGSETGPLNRSLRSSIVGPMDRSLWCNKTGPVQIKPITTISEIVFREAKY